MVLPGPVSCISHRSTAVASRDSEANKPRLVGAKAMRDRGVRRPEL